MLKRTSRRDDPHCPVEIVRPGTTGAVCSVQVRHGQGGPARGLSNRSDYNKVSVRMDLLPQGWHERRFAKAMDLGTWLGFRTARDHARRPDGTSSSPPPTACSVPASPPGSANGCAAAVVAGRAVHTATDRGQKWGLWSCDQTASFSSFAGRKATFLLAAICIVSPVAGLRPVRASRWRTSSVPRPPIRMRSPCFRCRVTPSTIPASKSCASFLGN
jgi:hypothetical protein